jgi:hypothetical protein
VFYFAPILLTDRAQIAAVYGEVGVEVLTIR